jgi:hypothetical protein
MNGRSAAGRVNLKGEFNRGWTRMDADKKDLEKTVRSPAK